MGLWVFILGILCLIVAFIFAKAAENTDDDFAFIIERITYFTCAFVGLVLIISSFIIWLIP